MTLRRSVSPARQPSSSTGGNGLAGLGTEERRAQDPVRVPVDHRLPQALQMTDRPGAGNRADRHLRHANPVPRVASLSLGEADAAEFRGDENTLWNQAAGGAPLLAHARLGRKVGLQHAVVIVGGVAGRNVNMTLRFDYSSITIRPAVAV